MVNVSDALNKTINFTCVEASDAVACMKKIEDGDADLITLDGGEILIAGTCFDINNPILTI